MGTTKDTATPDASDELLEALEAAKHQLLAYGSLVRELDAEGEHIELWTNDGDYIPLCPPYDQVCAAIAKAKERRGA